MDRTLLKPREPRRKVHIPARMRIGGGWVDINIRNVSSRGLMFRTAVPPRPGTVVEIRRAHLVIVARAMWSIGASCGVRTQDSLDIDALLLNPPASGTSKTWSKAGATFPERRRETRSRQADQAERSRAIGRMMQFGATVGWALAGATFMFLVALELLNRLTGIVAGHL